MDVSDKFVERGELSAARENLYKFRGAMNMLPMYNNSYMLQSLDKDMARIG